MQIIHGIACAKAIYWLRHIQVFSELVFAASSADDLWMGKWVRVRCAAEWESKKVNKARVYVNEFDRIALGQHRVHDTKQTKNQNTFHWKHVCIF